MIDAVVAGARQLCAGLPPELAARLPVPAGAAAASVSLLLRGDRQAAIAAAERPAQDGLLGDYLVALMLTVQLTIKLVCDDPAALAPHLDELATAWAIIDAEQGNSP